MKLEKEVTTQDGKQHLVPESGLEAYIKARTGPAEPYQRHFISTRTRKRYRSRSR